MRGYKTIFWGMFLLFLITNVAYLHRVPGLLGDEASEGENVYELLTREGITITGERSYIGPAIDYVRVPFVAVFNYSTLAVRVPMLFFSIVTFFLASAVLRRQFGKEVALWGLALLVFSPQYILYQRLGWTITLYPFFTFLILFLLQQTWRTRWVWVGLTGGIALANHIVFLPVFVGIATGIFVQVFFTLLQTRWWYTTERHRREGERTRTASEPKVLVGSLARVKSVTKQTLLSLALLGIGFWAGFGMQFAVLQFQTDDQGDPGATTQLFAERVRGFIPASPLYLSGSSYMARYTGVELSSMAQYLITVLVLVSIVLAGVLLWNEPAFWAWVIGLHAYLLATLYIIDRFTLRYFTLYTLGMWLIAGLGIGAGLRRLKRLFPWGTALFLSCITFALVGWMSVCVLVPFLETGGSTQDFSLGNRTNSAEAFVDARPLFACVAGAGPVHSENIHIWNRLQYISHVDPAIMVVDDDHKWQAELIVEYRDEEYPLPGDVCPELDHFRVLRK